MIFPITDLLDEGVSARWLARYFHPQGFGCPQYKSGVEQARVFRHSKRGLVDYRCKHCDRVYNLYTGTVFAGCRLSARQAVLLEQPPPAGFLAPARDPLPPGTATITRYRNGSVHRCPRRTCHPGVQEQEPGPV